MPRSRPCFCSRPAALPVPRNTKLTTTIFKGMRWSLEPGNRDESVKLLVDNRKLPGDVAAATNAVAADPAVGLARDAGFDLDGFKNVLKLRADWIGAAPAAPEKYLDLSCYGRALAGL
jgi:hypothetical protein